MSVRPSALSIRFVTSAIAAMPLRILVFRVVAISCLASPIRVSSSPLCALPFPFRSKPSRTVQCLFCSLRLGSPPFLSAAVPIRALPGSSVPSPVFSGRCHAISCQRISAFAVHGHSSAVHFPSAQSRALSFRFLWARFHSVSVRILAPPLASFPIPLVSAPVPASPYLRHANLGESVLRSAVSYRVSSARFRIRSDQVPSQHLKALSMRLKQSRADHLRCFSSPPDANPITSKPWQFIYALLRSVPRRFASFPLNSALRRFASLRLRVGPRHFGSKQGVSTPLRFLSIAGRSLRIRCIASPSDSGLCCAAPLPRFACQVYSMPSRVGAADLRFILGIQPCCRRSRCRHRPALPRHSALCRCCATAPARGGCRSPGTRAQPFRGCPGESQR